MKTKTEIIYKTKISLPPPPPPPPHPYQWKYTHPTDKALRAAPDHLLAFRHRPIGRTAVGHRLVAGH